MACRPAFDDDELSWMIYELNRQRQNLINMADELTAARRPHTAQAARYSATRIGHVLNRLLEKDTRFRITPAGRRELHKN